MSEATLWIIGTLTYLFIVGIVVRVEVSRDAKGGDPWVIGFAWPIVLVVGLGIAAADKAIKLRRQEPKP